MIDPVEARLAFEELGVTFFTGVPDSLLKDFNSAVVEPGGPSVHVVASNEGSAVALAAGHYIATGRPGLVYMQNSGLGNAVNPLASLAATEVYGIPMILMVGWRGEPGNEDAPQHSLQGRVTPEILDSLEIPVLTLRQDTGDWRSTLSAAVERAMARSSPAALLVSKGAFSKRKTPGVERDSISMTRSKAIEAVIDSLPSETLFVATTGYTARELNEVRERRGDGGRDFLMVGSMGHATAIALGVALSRPRLQVVCFDGDGAMAMHMGVMTMVGQQAPPNLGHVVLDNGVHESVGGQVSSLVGAQPAGIASNCGYPIVGTFNERHALGVFLNETRSKSGPWFAHVVVARGSSGAADRPESLPERLAFLRSELDA